MELMYEKTYTLAVAGHLCKKCGKPMKRITQEDLSKVNRRSGENIGRTEISCPQCREPLWISEVLCWD